ncbi:MAG: glucose 1-dehydrogenase [Hyphomicrobiales bacterium]|nr:MAG: glucose 1-dehydrogenase [Hyphomicrobiales bacterium]
MTARTAFVTGGGGGIGAAVCRALAATGARVVVADLNADHAGSVAAEVDGHAVQIDVTDPDSVRQAIQKADDFAGAIDILVNCAGWEQAMPFVDTTDAFAHKILEVNLIGATRVIRHVLPSMTERQWGRIINVASEAGRIGAPRSAFYAAAKGGLVAFSKSIAAEVAKTNVTVNVVSPGPVDTPMMSESQGEYWEKVRSYLERAIPIGRVGVPTDVAAAVAFFASDAAEYVTGQTLSISGGLTML